MARYTFTDGEVRVEQEITVGSNRWRPHAYKPAFIILNTRREEDPDRLPEEDKLKETHDGRNHDR
jgi:hypothetical protein